jgi:hypothetical protein
MLDDFSGVENHGEAFAAALGVPDNADATVAFRRCGVERTFDGFINGMELVVSSDFFGQPGLRRMRSRKRRFSKMPRVRTSSSREPFGAI